MFEPTHVTCPDCNGTGAEKPDCWLCQGRMEVHWRRAIRNGWTKKELESRMQDDDYAICPSCDGYTCDHCEGDGKVPASVVEQERDRALIFALTQTFPPFLHPGPRGGILVKDRLLSRAAVCTIRDERLANWFCSMLGDEVYLNDAGEQAARIAKVRHDLRCAAKLWERAK